MVYLPCRYLVNEGLEMATIKLKSTEVTGKVPDASSEIVSGEIVLNVTVK